MGENLKPFPFQELGAQFLAERKLALLADEMGLGKTVQAVLGLDRIRAKRVLVVSPSVARVNWYREFLTWAKIKRKYKVCVSLKDKVSPLESAVCSYEYVTSQYKHLNEHHWDAVVVDEAHYLKEPGAKRSKAVLGKKGVIRASSSFWTLTGTPAPNHPGELWLLLYTYGQTQLQYDAFIERFCLTKKTSYGVKVLGARRDRIPEFQQLLNPIMLRRLKKDVMKELPPIHYGHVMVQPGEVEVEILPSFIKYFLPVDKRDELFKELMRQEETLTNVWTSLGGKQKSLRGGENSVKAIGAMSESVSTLRRYIGLQKVDAAVELVTKELEAGAYNKIVIFAIHRDVIETMRTRLLKFKPVTLYGNTDPKRRQRNIDKFQNNPKCQVFIGNILAAGVAITLTSSHNVLFVEQDWVPGNNAQAVMRCHRIGQENPVSVRFMGLEGSLDEHIMYLLKRKTRDLTEIFDENILQNVQQFDNSD